MTHSELIRGMADDDLAMFLLTTFENKSPDFCECRPECNADLAADRLIPMERCSECMAGWLRKTVEVQGDG